MIKGTPKPLSEFVNEYQELGLDVAPFATQKGDRFTLRLIDPEHPEEGGAYLASFASGKKDPKRRVVEADRPHPSVAPGVYDAANKEASDKLNALIHSAAASKFVVCFCVIDDSAIKEFNLDPDDKDNTFLSVAYCNRVASDSYAEAKTESASATATAEAPARVSRSNRSGSRRS